MNFEGCSARWKADAERFLRAAYEADWSPEATAKKEAHATELNDDLPLMVVANQDPSSKKSTPSSIIKPATATKVVVKKPTSGFSAFSAFVAAHGAEDEDHDGHIVVEVVRKSEVDKYLQLPALPTTRNGRDTCPLEWWKMHSHELPCLAKMARQFLALPASSAGVERLFSAAGRMHDDLKKVTHESTLSMQLEVRVNVP